MKFTEYLLKDEGGKLPKPKVVSEEHVPYDSSTATRLARQLLAGAEGDLEVGKKLVAAFADTVIDAMEKEVRFMGAKTVGHGAPDESQMNPRREPMKYGVMDATEKRSRGYA